MRPMVGLLQNYEVALLFILLLLLMSAQPGEEVLDISMDSGQQGDLSARLIAETARVQGDQLEFNGRLYRSGDQLVDDLLAEKVSTIALQSSPQTPLEKLFGWMTAISAAGINVQLARPASDQHQQPQQ